MMAVGREDTFLDEQENKQIVGKLEILGMQECKRERAIETHLNVNSQHLHSKH